MALLVDDPLWEAHCTTWAHLVSDSSLEELHDFAAAHGLPPRSFDLDHYDVPASALRRLEAGGATRVDRRTLLTRLAASGLRVPQVDRPAARRAQRRRRLTASWADLAELLAFEAGGGWDADASREWDALGAELLERWDEPHRRYHDHRHLEEILGHLDDLTVDGALHSPVVLLAAWFHDAVHTGRTPDDEQASAELALERLGRRGLEEALPPGTAAEVARLILATADHRAEDPAAAALCDADLAILAAPAARYAQYTADVRAEYPGVGDADFAAGRAAVLRSIGAAAHIFATAPGRARWESRARANIAAELEPLTGAAGDPS